MAGKVFRETCRLQESRPTVPIRGQAALYINDRLVFQVTPSVDIHSTCIDAGTYMNMMKLVGTQKLHNLKQQLQYSEDSLCKISSLVLPYRILPFQR
mmetsp:Transcript_104724/g.291669  ORF Transcript_104724/g.291669 Transcript_104724/m.291669 type:complete len:97 (+) Transcript_104724:65-355(+)